MYTLWLRKHECETEVDPTHMHLIPFPIAMIYKHWLAQKSQT